MSFDRHKIMIEAARNHPLFGNMFSKIINARMKEHIQTGYSNAENLKRELEKHGFE